jgi:beta-galactosidase
MFFSDKLVQFIAHDYIDQDVENARHDHEIVQRDFIDLQLDHQQMGIGGDNSWGAEVHEKYWVFARPYEYKLWIKPV